MTDENMTPTSPIVSPPVLMYPLKAEKMIHPR